MGKYYRVTWWNKEEKDCAILNFEEAERLVNKKKMQGYKVRIERRRPMNCRKVNCRKGDPPRFPRFRKV